MGVGAQPTNTMRNLLIGAGLLKGKKAKAVAISKTRQKKLDDKKAEAAARRHPHRPKLPQPKRPLGSFVFRIRQPSLRPLPSRREGEATISC